MPLNGDNRDPGTWLVLFFHPRFIIQMDDYSTSSLLLTFGTTVRHTEEGLELLKLSQDLP